MCSAQLYFNVNVRAVTILTADSAVLATRRYVGHGLAVNVPIISRRPGPWPACLDRGGLGFEPEHHPFVSRRFFLRPDRLG